MIARRLFLATPVLLLAGCQHGGRLIWPEGHMRGGEDSPDKGDPPSPPDKGGPEGEGGENGEGEHD